MRKFQKTSLKIEVRKNLSKIHFALQGNNSSLDDLQCNKRDDFYGY